MLGLGVPEIFHRYGRETLCLSTLRDAYATLYRHLGAKDGDEYFGVDVWTADCENTVHCIGISSPLKPSELTINQRVSAGASEYFIQWKRDGTRVCAMARSNIFLLDCQCQDTGRKAAPGGSPVKIRSIGGMFIPGTVAMGATNEYIFFCHEDGLILQYRWDMSFIGVVSLPSSTAALTPWPPHKVSFGLHSSHLNVHYDSNDKSSPESLVASAKPIYVEFNSAVCWGGGIIGSAICSDGSICFLLTWESTDADTDLSPTLASGRYSIESSKPGVTSKHVLQSRFVSCLACDESEIVELREGLDYPQSALKTVHMACLAVESASDTSCRMELVVISISRKDFGSGAVSSAVLSVVSTNILMIDGPLRHCMNRRWSAMEYPFGATPDAKTDSNLILERNGLNDLKHRLVGSDCIRSDELLVVLGARIYCVKLDFRGTDEKCSLGAVLPVASIKFSFDFRSYQCRHSKNRVPGNIS